MTNIADLLRTAKTIAVVGLSNRKIRPSYGVSQYMQRAGYRVIPVNPNETEILGEKCYARLEDVPEHVDIVDSAIRIGAGAIWLQEGVTHRDAEEKAREAGLQVVADRCILKEHSRYLR